MTPRGPGRRRPRAACRLARLAVPCLAYGAEADCTLCGMIDFDHPVTCVALGTDSPATLYDRAEAEVVAQLDRVMAAGWTPRRGTQLAAVAHDHGMYAARAARAAAARRQAAPAADPPPF